MPETRRFGRLGRVVRLWDPTGVRECHTYAAAAIDLEPAADVFIAGAEHGPSTPVASCMSAVARSVRRGDRIGVLAKQALVN